VDSPQPLGDTNMSVQMIELETVRLNEFDEVSDDVLEAFGGQHGFCVDNTVVSVSA
jgi:hypothetical protein